MGEVRTKIKLVNSADLSNSRRGLITAEQVRSLIEDALVDTGAVRCAIPYSVMESLGVDIVSDAIAEYANGSTERVGLTEAIIFQIDDRNTVEEAFVLGDEVIIGQTVLEKLDLFIDNKGKKLIPNPKHPESSISKMK
jgi:predicted aspartyl protease